MPHAEFFTRFGLFAVKGFLDPGLCRSLLEEARLASGTPATVGTERGGTYVVDESVRKTKWANVSAETVSLVAGRLLTLKPELDRYFNVTLTDCQVPQFLVYRQGDFFQAHRDSRHDPEAAERSKERQVATVIFLNEEAEEPGPDWYGGGSLTFYGLMGDPRTEGLGFPLVGETGLLIAFRPDLLHEVTPVTHGERHTVVSWFR